MATTLSGMIVGAASAALPASGMSGPMWKPAMPPDAWRLLVIHPQPLPVLPALCLVLTAAYGGGVLRLRRRGHRWPPGRSVSFAVGIMTVLSVTATGIGGYGMALFSVHMAQHMVLSMLSPIFLLMGAPVTLALRALPAAGRFSMPRRALLRVLGSRPAGILTSPAVTLPLFIASLYGLYFTPLFDAAMRSWWGHNWMLLHFLAVGLLLFWPILAIDPSPHRTSPVIRMLELFAAMPFHAFFAVTVMMSTTLVVGSFGRIDPSWGITALGDQRMGGGIAWAFSEVPTLLVLVAVVVQWWRSSEREARRGERAARRDGDRELRAYNAWLGRLAAAGQEPAPPGRRPQP